jgi:hypothetical protein
MTTVINKVFQVEYPIDTVWNNLSDPEKIVSCVPGATLTEKVDDNNYKGHVELKFGPVKAGYDGLITFLQRDAVAKKMSLKGTGTDTKGKGSAEMTMDGTLIAKDGGTEVNITMNVNVTGMLAQFGSRLITDASNQVFDQFVRNFKSRLAGGEVDNALHAGSLVGGMIKGIFGGNKS